MRSLAALVVVVAMVAVACGGSDGTTTTAPDETGGPDEPGAPTGPAAAVADSWTATVIGEGTKPSLALDAAGRPAIAFLFEDIPEGFVAYATSADDWTVDFLVEGYFYGPIGLDFDQDDRPNIAYHDHQAAAFEQDLGDLTYAVRDADRWQIDPAVSDGHDGWDSTIRIGPDGIVRAAGVDPLQFDRTEGIEYYELIDGEWSVEAIGSGPIEYEWNVDLQVAPDGTVGLTYFLTESQDLILARRSAGGAWDLEEVATEGDVGRFSSFAFDSDGAAHISYWNATTAEVTYTSNRSGSWETSVIAGLDAVEPGFEGARRITSLALGTDASPVVAYSDASGVWIARLSEDGSWSSEQIVTAGARPLGQLVTLALDDEGSPHLAYFEVTGNSPLSGEVVYVTSGSPS